MSYKQQAIQALKDITPAGLLDVCKAFGFEMYTKDGSANIATFDVVDNLEHKQKRNY